MSSGSAYESSGKRGGYAEFYRNSQYAVFPQEHRALPGPRPSSMIMVDQGRHELTDPAVGELIVTTPLAASSCSYAWDMGDGWSGVRSQTGDLIVVPPNVESRWRVGGERRLLIFAIPVETVAQILGPECPTDLSAAFGSIAGSSRPDPLVRQLMLRLWQLGDSDEPVGRLLGESALSTLVCQLLALSRAAAEPSRANAMATRDMRRLIEHVDAHLHEEIGLEDLAATSGWSVRHFTRVFRQSTSETPHRWLMARRVERAKHLLGGAREQGAVAGRNRVDLRLCRPEPLHHLLPESGGRHAAEMAKGSFLTRPVPGRRRCPQESCPVSETNGASAKDGADYPMQISPAGSDSSGAVGMSDDKSMIGASIDFDRDGLQKGTLKLPHSAHRSAYGHIAIPIAVAKNGAGPTVLLTGGVHGDEYEGPIALARLIRELDLSKLTGRLIVVPAVNYPAFVAGTRTSPIDDINLNRTFPGKRNGTATEMIAHYVTTELLPRSDYLFDFHAGGSSLQYLPTLLAPRWQDPADKQKLEDIIEAFAPPNVVYYDSIRALSGEDRVIGNYAHQNQVFFATGEFGGGSTVNLEGLAVVETGLRSVLAHLKVLTAPAAPRQPRKIRRLVMDDPGLYAFSPRRGFFEPKFALGDDVKAGALAGLIYDLDDPWAEPVAVSFRHGGFAVCIRTFSLVEAGDCLGHLASDI